MCTWFQTHHFRLCISLLFLKGRKFWAFIRFAPLNWGLQWYISQPLHYLKIHQNQYSVPEFFELTFTLQIFFPKGTVISHIARISVILNFGTKKYKSVFTANNFDFPWLDYSWANQMKEWTHAHHFEWHKKSLRCIQYGGDDVIWNPSNAFEKSKPRKNWV